MSDEERQVLFTPRFSEVYRNKLKQAKPFNGFRDKRLKAF